MIPGELNPNHPMTRAVSSHWHKIAAAIMHKQKLDHIVITAADLDALVNSGKPNITIQELKDGMHVRLVDHNEARRLAKIHGGRAQDS